MASFFSPQPPQLNPSPAADPLRSRAVAAGAGAAWWARGWQMFRSSIGTWLGILVVYVVISGLLNSIPRIGAIAEWLLMPVFMGGIMLGCDALHAGRPLRITHLFDGFKGPHFVPLLLIGVFNLLLCVLTVVVAVIVLAAGLGMSGLMNLADLPADPWELLRTLGFTYLLLIVLALAAFALFATANWFAPTLIVLRGAKAFAAMTASVRASFRNWLPFLVYGMIGAGILVVATGVFAAVAGVIGYEAILAIVVGGAGWEAFTLGMGLLSAAYVALAIVGSAVVFGSTYASYRDTLAPEAVGSETRA